MLRSCEQKNSGLVNRVSQLRGTELKEVEEGGRRETDVDLDV